MTEYSSWDETLSEHEKNLSQGVQEQWDNGKFDDAILILHELLKDRPDSALFNVTLGQMYKRLSEEISDPNKALLAEKHFARAITLAPTSGVVSIMYFKCLLDMGKDAEALSEVARFKEVGAPAESAQFAEDYRDDIAAIQSRLNGK